MTYRPISYVYMLSWLLPLLALTGLLVGGVGSFALPFFAFFILPIADWLVGRAPRLPHHVESESAQYILEAFIPLCLGVLVIGVLCAHTWTPLEWVGNTLALGVQAGVGIAASHELGHRQNTWLKGLSRPMLWVAFFGHYRVDHNRNHHVWVGTPHDVSTARRGQSFYAFWLQAVPGAFRGGWRSEAERLLKLSLPAWHWDNEVLHGLFASTALLGVAWWLGGLAGVALFLIQAVLGISLLQAVDYIEHYGLIRQQRADGKFERATAAHSWSGNHRLSNYLLFELQRHADHHVRPTATFITLGDQAESPMLPASYPTMVLLALVPKLWFRVMEPKLEKHYHNINTQRGALPV